MRVIDLTTELPWPATIAHDVPRVLALRALGVPYPAGKRDWRPLRETLQRELAREAIDLLYIDHLGMLANLRDVSPAPARARTVLDQHNTESGLRWHSNVRGGWLADRAERMALGLS
jgi:hypothetical protein